MSLERASWCEIDRTAIAANIATLCEMLGPSIGIFVSLKGDATGCGDIEVGRIAEAAGVAGVAFGNIDRAVAAREAGIRLPILLYPTCLPQDAPALERYDMMPTLSTMEDVVRWSAHARSLDVFLKLDGGGFRAGALPKDAPDVARAIVDSGTLRLRGVYGHPMTAYGPADEVYTEAQIQACLGALDAIAAQGIEVPIRMVSSSAIILSHPQADLNAVDPGRLIVGLDAFDTPPVAGRQRRWRHALVGLKSRLVMVKSLADCGDVMPAPFLTLRPGQRIGLIPYGWSDGFPRPMPAAASALVRGRRVALLGPPHSEVIRVDLTDVPDAEIGDEVVLLGRSGAAEITVEDLASQWGEHPAYVYSMVCNTLRRVFID